LVETTRMLSAMQQYGKPNQHYYEKAIELLLALWFHAFVYYKIPSARHRAIYRNMVALDSTFKEKLLKELRHFLFDNKLSGVKMILGDKLLYPLKKRLK